MQKFLAAGAMVFLAPVLSTAVPPPIQATALRLDGVKLTGAVKSVSAGSVQFDSTELRSRASELRTDELLSIEFESVKEATPQGAVLEFANGDRLTAEVGRAEEDLLSVRFNESACRIPLETLRGIAFRPLDPDDGAAAMMFRESGDEDLVLLTNGDRLSGEFIGLTESDLTLSAAGRETRVPRSRIAALAFAPGLVSVSQFESPRQIVRSAAGWVTVRNLSRAEDGSWHADAAFGSVNWPSTAVRRVWFVGGRTEFLSDLPPKEFSFAPYLNQQWPLRKDRAVTGEPLSAGGKLFPKGIGVHSRSRVTYELAGRYQSLRAIIGLADSAGEIGSSEFGVEVDGREVFRSGPVTAADARPVNIDLSGAHRLILTVDFGRNGDVRDRANWCDAVLVRRE